MSTGSALAIAALCFSAAVQPLVSQPLGWLWLHPISWLPALFVLSRLGGRRAFLAGWLVGVVGGAAIFHWVVHTVRTFTDLGDAAAVAALALLAAGTGLPMGLFAWGLPRIRRGWGSAWPFGVAAWFTACELLTPHVFPYQQGSAWVGVPEVFLAATLVGVGGVSFLVIACNALGLQAIEAWHDARPGGWRPVARNAGVVALLLAAAVGGSLARLEAIARAEVASAPLRIALVQPGTGPEARRELMRAGAAAVVDDLVSLSREALDSDPAIDVLVWPEKVLLGSAADGDHRRVRWLALAAGLELWTGGTHLERVEEGEGGQRGTRRFNSAWRIDREGVVDRRYDKVRLVPFGEYVPFRERLPWLARIRGVGDLAAGEEIFVYERAPARFAFLVCYEAIFPDLVGEAVAQGADLLVNLTFDGWFGDSVESAQHLMLAAGQAALFGVPLVRSTTSGISAFVDARGLVREPTGLFTREFAVADVRPVRVPSPYARLGEAFAWGCLLASGVALGRRHRPEGAG